MTGVGMERDAWPDEVQARIAELRDADRRDRLPAREAAQRARAAASLDIRELKPQVHWALYDPKREEEIFANLATCNEGPLYDDNLREIYEAILHVMKEL